MFPRRLSVCYGGLAREGRNGAYHMIRRQAVVIFEIDLKMCVWRGLLDWALETRKYISSSIIQASSCWICREPEKQPSLLFVQLIWRREISRLFSMRLQRSEKQKNWTGQSTTTGKLYNSDQRWFRMSSFCHVSKRAINGFMSQLIQSACVVITNTNGSQQDASVKPTWRRGELYERTREPHVLCFSFSLVKNVIREKKKKEFHI